MAYGSMAVRICAPTAFPCWNSIKFNWITMGVATRCQLLVYSQCGPLLAMALDWLTLHTSLITEPLPFFPENKFCTKMPYSLLNSRIMTQHLWHCLQKLKLYLVWVSSMWPTLFKASSGMFFCICDFDHVLIVSLPRTGKRYHFMNYAKWSFFKGKKIYFLFVHMRK